MSDFPFKVGEQIDVEIEKLTFGGNGLARKSGVVIFVPLSAPGDQLTVKISEIKKRHAIAQIETIVKPSGDRVQPICPVYGRCGGCNWQHLGIEAQLRYKQLIVEEFLQKGAGKTVENFENFPIVPSPHPFRYRNRVQLKYQAGALGFFARKSHQIVDIEDCPLIEEPLAAEIPKIKSDLAKNNAKNSVAIGASYEKVELSLMGDGKTKVSSERVVLSDQEDQSGEGFSQVNRFQNEQLVKTVLKWMEKSTAPVIFDLYAGSGNFTFPLLEKFPKSQVIAVEMHSGAVKIAREKLLQRKILPKRCEFYCSDVGAFLKRFPITTESIVLLDPPRIGCAELVIDALIGARPQKIFYISCDPAALSRDLDRILAKSNGEYRLIRSQCFDMFPQTHHVETFVEISR